MFLYVWKILANFLENEVIIVLGPLSTKIYDTGTQLSQQIYLIFFYFNGTSLRENTNRTQNQHHVM